MEAKEIADAIRTTEKLLKNIPADKRALAFPVVLDRLLTARPSGVLEEERVGTRKVEVAARKTGRRKLTRPELVRKMVQAGWFKRKRRLGEITKELRRRGMKTPATSLPALLLPMVLEGVLEREHDTKGLYVYFSK